MENLFRKFFALRVRSPFIEGFDLSEGLVFIHILPFDSEIHMKVAGRLKEFEKEDRPVKEKEGATDCIFRS